jgi:NitT/TauT family transport system ATP-binding protein
MQVKEIQVKEMKVKEMTDQTESNQLWTDQIWTDQRGVPPVFVQSQAEVSMPVKAVLKDVTKIYGSQANRVEALAPINLSVAEGEFVSLIGPSGCGKSTLLRILAGIHKQSSGEVVIQKSSSNGRPSNAMVFQEYAIFPWRTALHNVAFGLEMQGVGRKQRLDRANHYLTKVGLREFANHYPHQLSGGMKQRVAIARALATDPEILLMDEPFGALDAQTRTVLQEALVQLWEEEQKSVVFITHSIEEAIFLSDRVAVMTARPGRIKNIYDIDLPRPRTLATRSSPTFHKLQDAIRQDLFEEVDRLHI